MPKDVTKPWPAPWPSALSPDRPVDRPGGSDGGLGAKITGVDAVPSPGRDAEDLHAVADAVLFASRALVGVAARSLDAAGDEITLPQFRALVLLAAGPRSAGALAADLAVHPSTATRLADRLVRKRLISRTPVPGNHREVEVALTDTGREIVALVLGRRRREIEAIVARIDPAQRMPLIEALQAFGEAAGEAPEQAWSQGWSRPAAPPEPPGPVR